MRPYLHLPSVWRRGCAGLVLLAVASGGGAARADDDDAAESVLARGAVAPPAALFERIADDFGGQVLKLELEHEEGDRIWVYEVKLLLADGQVIKVAYDAVTLEVLKVAGPRDRADGSDDDSDDDGGAPSQGNQGGQGAAGNAGSAGRGRSSAGAPD